MALLALALLLVLYPLVEGPQLAWPGWAFALLVAAPFVLAVFALQQRRRGTTGGTPLIAPGLFAQRGFTGGVLAQVALYAGVTGFFLVFALTLQTGLGFTALRTGLTFVAWSVGDDVGRMAARAATGRSHHRGGQDVEDQTPPAYEHERWQVPSRNRVRLSRFGIVCAVGLVLFASPWVLDDRSAGDEARIWQDLLSVLAFLCVVPMAAVAWSSVPQPIPHDRTMLVLTRALDPAERKAVTRSLRRGEAIHPAHHAYARAWVAQQRRGLVFPAVMTAVIWSQALNASGRAIGAGFFWLMTVAGIGITTLSVGALVLQLRRERSVREFTS